VADWRASLKLAPQTANQQHRDVLKMADHFTSLEAINPQAVKAWADKAHEHRMAAGLHLIEAKARIAAGEYGGNFTEFLAAECNDLSASRAYELIAIASGKTTQEEVRAQANARKQRHRAKAAATVRSGTERAAANDLDRRRKEAEAEAEAIRAMMKAAKPTPEDVRSGTEGQKQPAKSAGEMLGVPKNYVWTGDDEGWYQAALAQGRAEVRKSGLPPGRKAVISTFLKELQLRGTDDVTVLLGLLLENRR
jgi:hypothetical protein